MPYPRRASLAILAAVGLLLAFIAAVYVIFRPTMARQSPSPGQKEPSVPLAVCDSLPILMYHSIAIHPVNTLQITPSQ